MSKKGRNISMVLVITLPLLIFASGLWAPWRWHSYISVMREVAPINFYGKVVDEQGQPMKGANVQLHVSKPNWKNILLFRIVGDDPIVNVYYNLKTDAQGCFQLTGERGRAVAIEKIILPSYALESGQALNFRYAGAGVERQPNTFSYQHIGAPWSEQRKADPTNPVIFEMVPTQDK